MDYLLRSRNVPKKKDEGTTIFSLRPWFKRLFKKLMNSAVLHQLGSMGGDALMGGT
jgi:hypothetical protein